MALNLSTLTSPATSGNVLEEVTTTADFLESCPVLRNLSRGSNKGGDAKQDVALNQPKALPLIDGDGYYYGSGVNGNYAEVNTPILPATGDFDLSIDFVWKDTGVSNQDLFGQYNPSSTGRFFIYVKPDGALSTFWNGGSDHQSGAAGSIIEGRRHTARFNRTGNTFAVYLDGASYYSYTVGSTVPIAQPNSTLGYADLRSTQLFKGAIFSVTEGSNTDVDFTATNVRHGDTKFQCATGQVVTINQSGNDPATIIKKPVLRFANKSDDTTGICLQGLLNQTIDGGYMFAAFSVLGDGGEDTSRIFSVNNTGSSDGHSQSAIFSLRNNSSPDDLFSYQAGWISEHSQMFDDDNGDILHEALIKNGTQTSLVNNAGVTNHSNATTISAEEFNIVSNATGLSNAAIDLEYLALFDASITDAQADAVRNFINNRNTVFDLKDGFGYYFYDAQKAPVGNISSGSASWNGRIVGSDNGDTDKYATQGVSNDQPVGDGYVVTFADNSDHLDIPSTTLAGWQVVGASRGTFVYKVNANAVTELNLLGNAGTARQAGYLYGIILLPESATERDIQEARNLLIDRGASDGTVSTNIYRHFDGRSDIVDFKYIATSSVTNNANFAWRNCSNMTSFAALDLSHCSSFTNAWQGTTALTSFPADAKLGTEASNVNFTSAWESSGLTSFSTPLPKATNAYAAWSSCISLESFSAELPSVNNAREAWYNCSSLESFSAELPSLTNALFAWDGCSSLTSFDVPLPSVNAMYRAWAGCSSLTDFSEEVFANWNPSSISSGVFDFAWLGCSSLTSQSVENILVPIDASGKYATSTGASGGTALADAGIDITYDGSGLTAATTAAITSLKSKGWSIFINSVEQ